MNPNREESLFAMALEKPFAERGAFLKVACGEDEALRWRLEAGCWSRTMLRVPRKLFLPSCSHLLTCTDCLCETVWSWHHLPVREPGHDRMPNDLMAQYYCQRASAGLIIAEATVVSEQGCGWVNSPGIYNDEQEAGWRRLVAAVHAKGAPMLLANSGIAAALHTAVFTMDTRQWHLRPSESMAIISTLPMANWLMKRRAP